MLTNTLRTAPLALLVYAAAGASLAQEPKAIVKPPVESAVTPIEQIQLKGKTLKMDIKTLAEVQRLEQEKLFKEKIQKTMAGPQASSGSSSNPAAMGAAPAPLASPLPALPALPVIAPKPKIAKNTLLSVYGPQQEMVAEVYINQDQTLSLKKGDQWDGRPIVDVTYQGITLGGRPDAHGPALIPVGTSLKGKD